MKREVVPAILAKSETEFREKLRAIERETKLVQIDVMDGEFVPNTTWADPLVVARMKTPAQFEVHLMVKEPFREVILWGKLKNVRRTIVHAESTKDLQTLLHTVRATGKEVGLAVNPSTRIWNLESGIWSAIDFVLVMANNPGFSGRPFRRATLTRIATLRKRFPKLPIGVDIGVNLENAPLLRKAGATHIAAASTIFGQPNPVAAFRALRRAFHVQNKES
ncbi:MAG: ribulose-phosphate 3-epimerase [bacterium]|nr:ribulose-phosphate 3-epimerase [bacterium]